MSLCLIERKNFKKEQKEFRKVLGINLKYKIRKVMIFKKSIIYVVLIFCNLTNSSQAQTILSVKEKTNNITSFDLSPVRRITFNVFGQSMS